MNTLREAATQALEALEDFGMKHYENTGEVLHRDVYESLKTALAEPTRSQQLAAAGFTRRDTRLECDECGGKFTRQMLPIHKCEPVQEPVAFAHINGTSDTKWHPPQRTAEPVQEPVAWSFEARHIDTAFGPAVSIRHPGREHKYMRNVKPLYLAPPQRKPLTEEAITQCFADAGAVVKGQLWVKVARAIERAHGIT